MRLFHLSRLATGGLLALTAAVQIQQVHAAIPFSIRSSSLGPATVGQPASWTVDVFAGGSTLQYAFRLTDDTRAVVANRAFGANNIFTWIPLQDGLYTLTTDVKNVTTGELSEEDSSISVVSNVHAPDSRIVGTAHPLVAVYSTICDTGQVRVLYYPDGGLFSEARSTPAKQCAAGERVAFVIAGLKPQTTYIFQSQSVAGATTNLSEPSSFTTGALPDTLKTPRPSIETPQNAASSIYENLILTSFLSPYQNPVAFDNEGDIVWYYSDPYTPQTLLLRPVEGGTMLLNPPDGSLREVDLAGNTLHEITVDDAATQASSLGLPTLINFNHDAVRLPNGNTAAIAGLVTTADQGNGPQLVQADAIVVLDKSWKIIWAWNPFDKLQITRMATLNDRGCLFPCGPGASIVNDWTHANSLQYLPDGNLMVSLRAQDWIIKIDFRDGLGSGDVLWRLGPEGDFTTDATDAYPWFTHQHFATLTNGELTVFDNGNTRVAQFGGNSRGQVWQIDEAARVAHLTLNVDIGTYAVALGSAQRLGNGDYEFLSGWLQDSTGSHSEASEVLPDGEINFKWFSPNLTYRVFRMTDLYSPEGVQ